MHKCLWRRSKLFFVILMGSSIVMAGDAPDCPKCENVGSVDVSTCAITKVAQQYLQQNKAKIREQILSTKVTKSESSAQVCIEKQKKDKAPGEKPQPDVCTESSFKMAAEPQIRDIDFDIEKVDQVPGSNEIEATINVKKLDVNTCLASSVQNKASSRIIAEGCGIGLSIDPGESINTKMKVKFKTLADGTIDFDNALQLTPGTLDIPDKAFRLTLDEPKYTDANWAGNARYFSNMAKLGIRIDASQSRERQQFAIKDFLAIHPDKRHAVTEAEEERNVDVARRLGMSADDLRIFRRQMVSINGPLKLDFSREVSKAIAQGLGKADKGINETIKSLVESSDKFNKAQMQVPNLQDLIDLSDQKNATDLKIKALDDFIAGRPRQGVASILESHNLLNPGKSLAPYLRNFRRAQSPDNLAQLDRLRDYLVRNRSKLGSPNDIQKALDAIDEARAEIKKRQSERAFKVEVEGLVKQIKQSQSGVKMSLHSKDLPCPPDKPKVSSAGSKDSCGVTSELKLSGLNSLLAKAHKEKLFDVCIGGAPKSVCANEDSAVGNTTLLRLNPNKPPRVEFDPKTSEYVVKIENPTIKDRAITSWYDIRPDLIETRLKVENCGGRVCFKSTGTNVTGSNVDWKVREKVDGFISKAMGKIAGGISPHDVPGASESMQGVGLRVTGVGHSQDGDIRIDWGVGFPAAHP